MKNKKELLNQKKLKELLHYDPFTGVFTWLKRPIEMFSHCKYPNGACKSWNTNHSGQKAGSKDKNGNIFYNKICITLNKREKIYKAHRLVFLYLDGRFPAEQVDHIDGNGLNNKFDNLRIVSCQENRKNCSIQSNNMSGYTGVSLDKKSQKYLAYIYVDGKRIRGGLFINIEDAISRRIELNIEYGFHENHGRKIIP